MSDFKLMLITCVYSMMIVVIMKFKEMGKLPDNFVIFEKKKNNLSRAKEPEIFRDSGSFSLFRLDLEAKGKHEEVQKTSQRARAETNQYIFTKKFI